MSGGGGAPAPLLVLVTGPPAAGKSSIAAELARELGLPLLTKDGFKETLFDALGTGDRAWSRRLGQATFPLLYHAVARVLAAGCGAVLEGNFAPGIAERELEALPPHRLVQVFCSAPADLLAERFVARAAERHPGHVDHLLAPRDQGNLHPRDRAPRPGPGPGGRHHPPGRHLQGRRLGPVPPPRGGSAANPLGAAFDLRTRTMARFAVHSL